MASNDDDGVARNALQGATLLRFVDGSYSDKDRNPIPIGTQLLVREIDVILQRWQGGVATIAPRDPVTGKLADPDQLNEQVPIEQWEADLNGNPRPPWERYFIIRLVNVDTGQQFCFVSATASASMAYSDLKGAMETKRFLHGVDLFPFVELRTKMWKPKKFAARPRPYFHPIHWMRPGGGDVPSIAGPAAPAAKQIAAPVKQIEQSTAPKKTTREIIDDEIPFN
jgi:hypothetical protein